MVFSKSSGPRSRCIRSHPRRAVSDDPATDTGPLCSSEHLDPSPDHLNRLPTAPPRPWRRPSKWPFDLSAVPCRTSTGTTRADEPRGACLRRGRGAGPDRIEMKVRAVVWAGEVPPRTSSAHLIRRASTATGGGTSRAFCSHRVSRSTRTWGEPPLRPPVPASPREGRCVPRRPRCVPPTCARSNPRIAPLVHPSGPPVHAAPVPRRTPTLCRAREPAPFRPSREARHDVPSIRGGSIERYERLVASPSRNPSIAAPK
jgi:hypothetical protein